MNDVHFLLERALKPINERGIAVLRDWIAAECECEVFATMPYAEGYERFRRFSCGGGYGVRDCWEISSRTFVRALEQLGYVRLVRNNKRHIGGLRLLSELPEITERLFPIHGQ